jgi:hypothetical protein
MVEWKWFIVHVSCSVQAQPDRTETWYLSWVHDLITGGAADEADEGRR